MITKYYVNAAGNYIGGFQGAQPPSGSIEVPNAPEHAADTWVNGAWLKNPAREKNEFNAAIKKQIEALDIKRIRPLAEGDALFLDGLNKQIAALRAQLKP